MAPPLKKNPESKLFLCFCVQELWIRLHLQTAQGWRRLMGCRSETFYLVSLALILCRLFPQPKKLSRTSARLRLVFIGSGGCFGCSLISGRRDLKANMCCCFFHDSAERDGCSLAPLAIPSLWDRPLLFPRLKFKDATASAYTPETGNIGLHLTAFLMRYVIEHWGLANTQRCECIETSEGCVSARCCCNYISRLLIFTDSTRRTDRGGDGLNYRNFTTSSNTVYIIHVQNQSL